MQKIMCVLLLALITLSGAAFAADSAIREIGIFHFIHYAADGTVKDEWNSANNLADEGEQLFLDVVLRNGTAPTQFYLRLSDSTSTCSIAETNTLTSASAGEPSTFGYSASLVERSNTGWPTLALDSGDYMATSSTESFSASGGSWGPVYCAFLATSSDNTGKLVSWAALSTGRTLADGESLTVTYKVKLQ